MDEITIRGTRAQRNLMEWSQRVADCRSSELSVTRWCAEHGIKPKTYYNWQKKVFAAMFAQQQSELSDTVPRFAELPPQTGEKATDHRREANGAGCQRSNRRRRHGRIQRSQRGNRLSAL